MTADGVLRALTHVRRARLLVDLLDSALQTDVPTDDSEHSVEMHHVHLPKLDDCGFVEWDRESNAVSRGRNFEAIRPLLELLVAHGDELPADWL